MHDHHHHKGPKRPFDLGDLIALGLLIGCLLLGAALAL
jgi:hypothetical protein